MSDYRKTLWAPTVIGATIGLLAGTVGLLFGLGFVGAMSGAVFGGAAAAAVSDRGIRKDTLAAGAADLTSSTVVFTGFILGLAFADGDPLTGVLAVLFITPWGLLVAIPVATLSLGIAIAAGGLTAFLKYWVESSPGL